MDQAAWIAELRKASCGRDIIRQLDALGSIRDICDSAENGLDTARAKKLAEALAVSIISSLEDHSYEAVLLDIGIDPSRVSSWCFQSPTSKSQQEEIEIYECCKDAAIGVATARIWFALCSGRGNQANAMRSIGLESEWIGFLELQDEVGFENACDEIRES